MKYAILFLLIFLTNASHLFAQSKLKKDIAQWQKCVINLETEGKLFAKFEVEQKLEQYRQQGYTQPQLDSIREKLNTMSASHTGTAVYVKDGNRKYLITAKHVLLDSALTRQKIYEQAHQLLKPGESVEAIYSRISIRTPIEYARNNSINNRAVYNYEHVSSRLQPYVLLPDQSDNDIAVISLQEKNYKLLDEILQQDGYQPIPIDKINSPQDVNVGEDIYTIGFPENISVVGKVNLPSKTQMFQLNQIVSPFTTFGKVSMSSASLNFFYAAVPISFGNSGGPVIKDGRLVGIVSGINKYSILSDASKSASADQTPSSNLYGIGQLVKVVKCTDLMKYLRILQSNENNPLFYK
jgi:hypothetical protein